VSADTRCVRTVDAPPAAPPADPNGLVVPRPRRGRRIRKWIALGVLGVVVVVTTAVVAQYRRQIWSALTHLKGSPTHTVPYRPFTTAPDLHLAVVGDIGDSGSRLDATAAAIARIGGRQTYQELLLLGDNVYPSGDPAELPTTVFRPFAPVLHDAQLLAILGNHDVKDGHGPAQMRALGMPGRWWAREIGDVLIVGLDSNDAENPRQRAFVRRQLSSSSARWKIVALHHPPYSAGYQGSAEDVRRTFSPIFERNGVQLVLSGHDHDYQRSKRIRGVTYVVTGAAAGTRRTGEESFTAVSFSWHHFVDIGVFPDRLVLRAVNQDGRVADAATIDR
jgi:3',5'-cyclic AMP phosphodiesterase CpdA